MNNLEDDEEGGDRYLLIAFSFLCSGLRVCPCVRGGEGVGDEGRARAGREGVMLGL